MIYGEFCGKFDPIYRKTSEVHHFLESKLVLLTPHPKSLEFSDFIHEIWEYCEFFNNRLDTEDTLEVDYNLFNKQFRDSMENFYLKIQKYLHE
jgi:hypothetical protein